MVGVKEKERRSHVLLFFRSGRAGYLPNAEDLTMIFGGSGSSASIAFGVDPNCMAVPFSLFLSVSFVRLGL